MRASKLYYLARCLLYFLVRGRAVGAVRAPKSIVIIQGAQMGDMVCTTPMFRAVKEKYPGAKLTVIGNAINKETLRGNPDVDAYIVWADEISKLIPVVRALNADFGCTTSPQFLALALLYLAGVRVIAAPKISNGWSPYETRPYRLVRRLVIPVVHMMRQYVPRQHLRLLEPIGIVTENTKKYVYSTAEGDARARVLAEGLRSKYPLTVVILPGAGNRIKEWPTERFVEVANHVIETYNAGVFICGTDATRKEADMLLAGIHKPDHVSDLTGMTNIDEAKAFYKYVDLVVAVDTGPMFFAEAHGTATVDIAGNIDENEQAPNDGNLHLVVVPPNRGDPEVLTMNARMINYERALAQIRSVTVPMVTAAIDTVVPRIQRRSL